MDLPRRAPGYRPAYPDAGIDEPAGHPLCDAASRLCQGHLSWECYYLRTDRQLYRPGSDHLRAVAGKPQCRIGVGDEKDVAHQYDHFRRGPDLVLAYDVVPAGDVFCRCYRFRHDGGDDHDQYHHPDGRSTGDARKGDQLFCHGLFRHDAVGKPPGGVHIPICRCAEYAPRTRRTGARRGGVVLETFDVIARTDSWVIQDRITARAIESPRTGSPIGAQATRNSTVNQKITNTTWKQTAKL